MGTSSSSMLSLVLTDNINNQYCAGDTVNGIVYLNLRGQNRDVQSLNVVIHGEESVIVPTAEIRGGMRKYCRNLIKIDVPIQRFQNAIQQGQYEYPFRAQLPSTLPSSISKKQNKKVMKKVGVFEILYTVSIKLVVPGKWFGSENLQDIKEIIVSHRPRDTVAQEPLLMHPHTHDLESFKCVNRGFLAFGGYISNPIVPVDNPVISLRLASNYWYPVKGFNASHLLTKVVVSVRQDIITKTHYDDPNPKISGTTIYSETVDIRPGQTATEQDLHVNFGCYRQHKNIYNNLMRNNVFHALINTAPGPMFQTAVDAITTVRTFNLTLPSIDRILHSYIGTLINVRHYLVITIPTGWSASDHGIEASIYFQPPHASQTIGDPAAYAEQQNLQRQLSVGSTESMRSAIVTLDMSEADIGGYAVDMGEMGDDAPSPIFVEAISSDPAEVYPRAVSAMNVTAAVASTGALGVLVMSNSQILSNLISEMGRSVDDRATIARFISVKSNCRAFMDLTPELFGNIIKETNEPNDQPIVTKAIVNAMIEVGVRCTVDHLVQAVRNADNEMRSTIVKQNIAQCYNFPANYLVIEKELNEYDKAITRLSVFGAQASVGPNPQPSSRRHVAPPGSLAPLQAPLMPSAMLPTVPTLPAVPTHIPVHPIQSETPPAPAQTQQSSADNHRVVAHAS